MKFLPRCLLWASVGAMSLRYVCPLGWYCSSNGRILQPTVHSALVSHAANPAATSRWWPSIASPPVPPLPGLSLRHLQMPRLRLRAAMTVERPAPAEVTTSVAEKLLQDILPKVLGVAYSCSQMANGGFQASAHVEVREIDEAEARTLQGELAVGAAAADAHWGEFAYIPSPLPIGLFFHHVETSEEAGAERSSGASIRIRMPGVRSQTFLGAISASTEEAEQSVASVLFYTVCNMFPSSMADLRRSSRVPANDFKTKLSQLLIHAASQQVASFVVDCEISAIPVGGFTALVQVLSEETVRKSPDRIDNIQSTLRTSVCASRKEAGATAMDTVYEALLKPLWKTTVKLGRSRPVALPSLEVSEGHFQRHLHWRAERLEALTAESLSSASEAASSSLDLWFGGVCLCCLAVVSRSSWQKHATGQRHRSSFNAVPVQLSPQVKRPPTEATVDTTYAELFWDVAGWADSPGPVLSLGEMDYSFSLVLARLIPSRARLLATSFLEEHDPLELEYHPKSDAERTMFSRRTLPDMGGALRKNLRELKDLGAEVKHGVDATNLQTTLRVRFREPFRYVIFPFPRASLRRENDPQNSALVHGFFRSAQPGSRLVSPHGVLQLLLLENQYEEWDVAGAASATGLVLVGRVAMPQNFYQSRDVSGQRWIIREPAELLCFKRSDMLDEVPAIPEESHHGVMNRSFSQDQGSGRRSGHHNDERERFGRSSGYSSHGNRSGGGRSHGRSQEWPQVDHGSHDSGPQSSRDRRDGGGGNSRWQKRPQADHGSRDSRRQSSKNPWD